MTYQNKSLFKNSHKEVSYWRKQLKNNAPWLNFPTDKVRAIDFTSEAEINHGQVNFQQNLFTLNEELSQSLAEIAQQANVSISTVLLGAFQVLLYRYTNQADIVVGCIDWRDQCSEEKPNILPTRTIIKGRQKFNKLLIEIENQISESSRYLDLNIVDLVTGLKKAENLDFSLASLTQMQFRYKSNSITSQNRQIHQIAEPELLLDITEKPQYLNCQIKYNTRLFDSATIQRIADNYQVLLHSIAINPATTIDSLPLISTAEREQVLFQWNQTETKAVPECLHQLFETQAKQNPEAIAIICGGQQLSYGELNQQANRLAHYLQTLGITKGSLVGLCIERSLSMVIAVLAILKAGGAYVPLDGSNPTARLAFILEDARVKLLLTQASLIKKLPIQIEQTVCIDLDWDRIAEQSQDNLTATISTLDLAQIVYTSGSTGKPKGVMLTHGNLSHYAQSLQLTLEISPADVYLHRGSIALIVSARQLLMPLAQGATVLIVTTEETRNPLKLFELIKRYEVTVVDHVPSFWRNFWAILQQQTSSFRHSLLDNQVRLVAAGGEQVTPEIYQCWRETFKPEVKLANIYGQTEGTGVVTLYQIPDQINCRFKSLPVGRPIPNMKVYLLDRDLQPIPIGVAAEIHISGAGVARGYLNRPKLTAEKFVANPYVAGERLYKTGDMGRYLPDGSIQFLGRVDRQVNIQGLRIELGEIEAVLSQSKLVQEAAVVVRENRLGETLSAYVVPSATEQPTVEMIRSYLQQKLPSYMVPGSLIMVETFPLTTSGKVDRRALAALKLEESAVITPRDRLELEIVQMLQNILGVEGISVDDNFIELGGNSLIAARLATQIQHKYKQQIPISNIFQAPTSENLAELIRQEGKTNYPQSFVPIKHGNSRLVLFGVHNLGYGLELYRPLAQHLDADISLYGLSSFFSNEPDKPHARDIASLASYYNQHIQQVQPQGPYHIIGISFGGVIAYETARRLVAEGHEVKFLGLVDTFIPGENSIYKSLSLKESIIGHAQQIRTKGVSHVLDRIKWRIGDTMDIMRSNFYKIDWIKDNFADTTSRNFSQAEYVKQRREHQQVNQNYVIQPYPGKVTMFRAANDIDLKLDWQELAQSGLSIYDIPGDHLEIVNEPLVQILAEHIQLALLEAN